MTEHRPCQAPPGAGRVRYGEPWNRGRAYFESPASSFVLALKFLMPWPMPRPISGSRLAPKINRMMARMMSISGNPMGPRSATSSIGVPLVAILSLTLPPGWAGAARGLPDQFASGVAQVEVYATVVDATGAPVRGLTAADFEVREDGVPQAISTFVAGEFPATIALAVDRSVSMAGQPLQTARTAARVLLASLRADDRAMLIGIGGAVEVLAGLSTDRRPLLDALDAIDAWSTTPLHDAIIASVDLIEAEPGRRALVLITDGVDRYSDARADDVLARVRGTGVMTYTVALGRQRPTLFVEMAALSGGRSVHLRDARELAPALSGIATELREQYLLGYVPRRPWNLSAAEWRGIDVRVARAGARVRARAGYLTAPSPDR
jgi:Ca-activated chloride channel family protein